VLVVDRVNTYSIDLTLWRHLSDDPWLLAVVIAAYRPMTWTNAALMERHFIKKPLEVTNSLPAALAVARTYTTRL
jgi:hypothetical protein